MTAGTNELLQKYSLTKLAYTPSELIELGVVGSRTSLYRLIDEKKIRLSKCGKRSVFLANDVATFLDNLRGNTAVNGGTN